MVNLPIKVLQIDNEWWILVWKYQSILTNHNQTNCKDGFFNMFTVSCRSVYMWYWRTCQCQCRKYRAVPQLCYRKVRRCSCNDVLIIFRLSFKFSFVFTGYVMGSSLEQESDSYETAFLPCQIACTELLQSLSSINIFALTFCCCPPFLIIRSAVIKDVSQWSLSDTEPSGNLLLNWLLLAHLYLKSSETWHNDSLLSTLQNCGYEFPILTILT